VLGKTLDGRSDLFSVGVMLYEMITGERPFEGQSITTIMYKIVHETPISPRKLDASIHSGLSAMIEKSLAKAPEDRFQTGAELAKALETYETMPVARTSSLDLPTQQFPIPTGTSGASISGSMQAAQPGGTPAVSNRSAADRVGDFIAGMSPKSRKRWIVLFVIFIFFLVSRIGNYERNSSKQSAERETPSSSVSTPTVSAPTPPSPTVSQPTAPEGQDTQTAQPLTEHENATENKSSALLNVNSNPPGAEIEIDGKPTGKTTPNELQLPRGQHSVKVVLTGFTPASATFKVKGGEEIEFSPQLSVSLSNVPMPRINMPDLSALKDLAKQGQQQKALEQWAQQYGDGPKLILSSSPPGARILIDGKDSGETTPAVISTNAGTHHLRLELDGFEPVERDFAVESRKPGKWKARLKPSGSNE